MVLVFFGFVATVGSAYVQHATMPGVAWVAALAVGLPACGILLANNVRDVDTDRVTGKRTLAVRSARRAPRGLYVACIAGAIVAVVACGAFVPSALARDPRAAARDRAGARDADAARSARAHRRAGRDGAIPAGALGAARRRPVGRLGTGTGVPSHERRDEAAEHRRVVRAAARDRRRAGRARRRCACVRASRARSSRTWRRSCR